MNLEHKLVTNVKYLYPCFSHIEKNSKNSIILETDTSLDKIFIQIPKVEGMKYIGEDFFGNPLFSLYRNDSPVVYYAIIDGSVYMKGNDPDGEPIHQVKNKISYERDPENLDKIEEFVKEAVLKIKNMLEKDFDQKINLSSFSYEINDKTNNVKIKYSLVILEDKWD